MNLGKNPRLLKNLEQGRSMSVSSEDRILNRVFGKELFRFTPGWVTDTWNLPSGDLKEEFDFKEYPKRNTPIWCSLTKCIKEENTFKCVECSERDLGIPWLPDNYNKWTDQEKEEWKVRVSNK